MSGHRTSPRTRLRLFGLLAGCAAAALTVGATGPAHAGTTATVMTVQSQVLRQPYSWQDPASFGVDDFANWTVTGQLAPGDSYTYLLPWSISAASEAPDVSAGVRWTGATTLQLTSVVPMNGTVSDADSRVDHTGQTITAPVLANTAALCMFFEPASTFAVSFTVTNTGTALATGVTLSGQASNGYAANYAPFCNHADGDGDGWNDTLEQGTVDLTAPAAGTSTARLGTLGSDYLARRSATTTADDEVDSYPPDVTDDGLVDQSDVDRISSWVGQGTGVPFAHVDYSGVGPNRYQAQAALWRRYDLNGDGWVTSADVAWVQAEVGRPVPDPVDVLAPWAAFDPSMPTSFPRRTSVFLGAYARDNGMLTSVRFAVNGSTLSQQCTDPMTEMTGVTSYHDPATPQYECVWATPGKRATVTLTVTATDAAGHTYTDTRKVTVS